MKLRPATPWLRLAAAARRAPARAVDDLGVEAPAGFATRVIALSALGSSSGLFGGTAFERLAARALGFACAGALAVTIWSSLPASTGAAAALDSSALADAYVDPVGSLLEAVET
jgi:hypothetical protein